MKFPENARAYDIPGGKLFFQIGRDLYDYTIYDKACNITESKMVNERKTLDEVFSILCEKIGIVKEQAIPRDVWELLLETEKEEGWI